MGQCAVLVKHFIVMRDMGRELHINAQTVTAYPTLEDAFKRETQQTQGLFRMLTLEHRVWEVAVSHLDLDIGLADPV
jgi:hypothetical protein